MSERLRAPGTTRQLVEAAKRHANPMGTLHGGDLCDVVDEKGALVCRLSSTCMVLRGEAAGGR